MLQVTVKIVDADKVMAALSRFDGDLRRKLGQFLKAEGADMEREIKQSLSTGGNLGRTGPRGGRVRIHSRPGQPPFTQSGNLRAAQSSKTEVGPVKADGTVDFTLDVGAIARTKAGAEVVYARRLELGGGD